MSTIFYHGGAAPELEHGQSWQSIAASLSEDDGVVQGAFAGLRIASNFQPIFSLAHQRVVGFEGLMRAASETSFQPPLDVLARARDDDAIIRLDRLCRAIHLRNFVRYDTGNAWLFLNVNPQVIAHGGLLERRFGEELERVGMPPSRVVIEILETALIDDSPLIDAAKHYRDMGCLIAIDDFGAGYSNFDRIARLRPDIVKLDRSIVLQAAGDCRIRALVPGMVSLLHESGSLVVMEGIETEQEAMIAMDADADLVQGRYFASPAPWARLDTMPRFDLMYERFRSMSADGKTGEYQSIAPYLESLGRASVMLANGGSIAEACRDFLELPLAERCYLLDENGMQIGNSVHARGAGTTLDPRFAPLDDARGANWSRRHYFRRATAHPGKVQVTRPYLSIASATSCITASIAFRAVNGDLRVLCGDMIRDERG